VASLPCRCFEKKTYFKKKELMVNTASRTRFLFLLLVFCCLKAGAQAPKVAYNQRLADSLGSDANGMKRYVLVLLKTGGTTVSKEVSDSLFRGHMDNIGRLAKEGLLVVAGPLQKNDKQYRGIFILNVKTIEEGKALLQTDPAVKAGLLEGELYGWYGSAALPLYMPHHDALRKQ
jgi:uncharacterized protein YciI